MRYVSTLATVKMYCAGQSYLLALLPAGCAAPRSPAAAFALLQEKSSRHVSDTGDRSCDISLTFWGYSLFWTGKCSSCFGVDLDQLASGVFWQGFYSSQALVFTVPKLLFLSNVSQKWLRFSLSDSVI